MDNVYAKHSHWLNKLYTSNPNPTKQESHSWLVAKYQSNKVPNQG